MCDIDISLPPSPSHPPSEHDIPETLTLQVICSGQVVAQTEFTYYASAQYNSDLLFQYLAHNFPSYFPEVGGPGSGGGDLPPGGSGGGNGYPGGGGGGYFDNIPHSSYNLLLGSCRLGIEELVVAVLELPSMLPITTEQVCVVVDSSVCPLLRGSTVSLNL